MDGILPLLFWAGVFGLFALVMYVVIRIRQRFFPTELDLEEARARQEAAYNKTVYRSALASNTRSTVVSGYRDTPALAAPPQSRVSGYTNTPAPVAPPLPVIALPAIASALNIAIIGPKNSGKTTLLRALLGMRSGYSESFDPHNEPGKWPVPTVGGGEQFDRIHFRLLAAHALMRQRYEVANRGERSQATYQTTPWRVTLAGDEWGGIVGELPDVRATKDRAAAMGAGLLLGALIARGRKVGIGLLIAAHDDTAAQFGLRGEMGLVGCFNYLIYLGAQATGNTAVPSDVRAAAAHMARPAVVRDTNRNTWALLMLDNLAALRASAPVGVLIPNDYAAAVQQIESEHDGLLNTLLSGTNKPQPQPQPQPRMRFISASDLDLFDDMPSASQHEAKPEVLVASTDDPVVWTCPDNGLEATYSQVIALLVTKRTEADIVKTLWQIDATRGARYKMAQAVVAQIRSEVMAQVLV